MKNMKNKLFVTLGILGMSLLSYAGTKHSLETSLSLRYLKKQELFPMFQRY